MSDLYFLIALDVLFLAGTLSDLRASPERHIARLQASRPEWSATLCRQFLYVMRIVMAIATVALTIYLIAHFREIMHR